MAEAITTAEQAIARANALTRLHTVSGAPPAASLIRMPQDDTPFLGEPNMGRPVWRVDYPNSSLKFASAAPNAKDRYRRSFAAYLEAVSGRLFSISSTHEGEPDPDMRPMPMCGPATAQLSAEEEVYGGYPDAAPAVDFLGALETILNGGIGSPFQAKQIHAAYVTHSRMGSALRGAWAITFLGIPPISARGPQGDRVPVWQRNFIRNVVDAATGEPFFATNGPMPS